MARAHLYGSTPTPRKPHRDWAGYICECRNHLSGGHNVVTDIRQGGDGQEDEGGRYIVTCDAHSTLIQTTNLRRAREMMRDATFFCEDCRALAGES